jgi:drug/metabolite transporter (DMT)-like permease
VSFLLAVFASVLFGIGTVFEATAARRSHSSDELDPRLLIRMLRQWAFVASGVVGLIGMACVAIALRHLQLFVVQAVVASSVGVSAVVAARTHHEKLGRQARIGLVGIVGGLGVLALASTAQEPPATSLAFRWGLLVATVLLWLAARFVAGRRVHSEVVDVALLGALAGSLYGIGDAALRVIDRVAIASLFTNPAAWAALVGCMGGVLVLATALQRGSVAVASGAMTTFETLLPTIIGVVLLGERPRHGWALPAAFGFVLAVAGSIALCEAPEGVEAFEHGLDSDVPADEAAR